MTKRNARVVSLAIPIAAAVLTLLAVAVSVPMTFCSAWIVRVLYGPAYLESAGVLTIHIWASVLVFWGVAANGWYLAKGLQHLVLARTVAGAVVNVLANLVLIPAMGIKGAALGTIIAQLLVSWLLDLPDVRTRELFWMKSRSLPRLVARLGGAS